MPPIWKADKTNIDDSGSMNILADTYADTQIPNYALQMQHPPTWKKSPYETSLTKKGRRLKYTVVWIKIL